MRKVLFWGRVSVHGRCPEKAIGAETWRSKGGAMWVFRRKFQPGNPAGARGPEAGACLVCSGTRRRVCGPRDQEPGGVTPRSMSVLTGHLRLCLLLWRRGQQEALS